MMKSKRLELIDSIRGLTLISMILYHFCWDLKYLKGFSMLWYETFGSYLWQQSICWTFILIAGFCLHFARNPIRNGVIVFLCGIIITTVTELFVPEAPVYFGVLTFLGSAMIIVGALKWVLIKLIPGKTADISSNPDNNQNNKRDFGILLDPFWGFIVNIILFGFTKSINQGVINLFLTKINLPANLFDGSSSGGVNGSFLNYLGFMQNDFYSSDYFSLMPWIFLFLSGYFLYGVLKPRFESAAFHINIKPLSWIGRHSLLIYMLHQPVLYGITMLIR
ncbi:heparan-alpha-glucosaminide N-acetyltransferase [Butyrivibrio sp. JL13D10]|uniref:heparan-alpha-glucosaminide N-acetyltransferase n=1 Tax=Butyrivibrio sp. JL13D10 TaxID=3236815 RepID=UPI0038B57743